MAYDTNRMLANPGTEPPTLLPPQVIARMLHHVSDVLKQSRSTCQIMYSYIMCIIFADSFSTVSDVSAVALIT